MVRRLLSIALLVTCAAGAQTLGPPTQLDAPVRWVSQRDQLWPDLSPVAAGVLAVWQDDRDAKGFDVWAGLLTADGRALQGLNAPLTVRPGAQTLPSVAASPSTALVVALDQAMCGNELLALAVDPTNLNLTRMPALLTSGACTTDRPAVVWNDSVSRFLVVWGRHGAGAELHGAMLDATGTVVLPDFVITTAANTAQQPAIATTSLGFLVTWSDDRLVAGRPNLYATTVSGTGAIGTPTLVSASTASQTAPCLTNGFVGWVENGNVLGSEISEQGVVFGSVIDGGTGNRPSCRLVPSMALPVGLFGAVLAHEVDLTSGRQLVVRQFTSTGGFSPPAELLPVGTWPPWGARLVVTDRLGRLLVAATRTTTYVGGEDVVARQAETDLSSDAGLVRVGSSAAPQQQVTAAYDGRSYLVAWNDLSRFTSYEAIGQLVEPGTGRLLAGDAGLTLSAGSHNLASYPMVGGASDAGFFLSWGDVGSAGALNGRTVSPTGALGGWQQLNENSTYVNHHVTVAFTDQFATLSLKSDTLRIRRTSFGGARLQAETVLTPTTPGATTLAATSLGDRLFVVFPGDAGSDVHGVFIHPDGGLGSPSQLVIAQQAGSQLEPAVSAGGGVLLVAWTSPADGGASSPREVFATRLSLGGVVLDSPVRLGSGTQPTIAWLGSNFLVGWNQGDDIVGVTLAPSGAQAGPQVVLAGTAEVERRPTLTAGPPGEALLTWEAYVAQQPFQAFRAHARLVSQRVGGGPGGGAGGGVAGGSAGGIAGGGVAGGSAGGIAGGGVAGGIAGGGVAGGGSAGGSAGGIAGGGAAGGSAGGVAGGASAGGSAGGIAGGGIAGGTSVAGGSGGGDAGGTAGASGGGAPSGGGGADGSSGGSGAGGGTGPDGGPVFVEAPDAGAGGTPGEPRQFAIGFGCTSTPMPLGLVLAVMLLNRRRLRATAE